MVARSESTRRILQIGQDDLFGAVEGVDSRFVATGHSITPGAPGGRALSVASLTRLVKSLSVGQRYDALVLPVVRFDWPYDKSRLKRRLRGVAGTMAKQRLLTQWLNRWLRRRAQILVALDRFDTSEVDAGFIRALPSVSTYYKANLKLSDIDDPPYRGVVDDCRLKFLRYWISAENYPDPGFVEKDIDVLFIGALNSIERIEGRRVLERMRHSGFRVLAPTERVPFDEYQRLTSRAWLTLSPQGYGYNGFRHYEAMLLNSVPVINISDPPVLHDFVDGGNCLLYEPSQLQQRLEHALSDRRRLAAMSTGLREFVLQRHSIQAVGRYLLEDLFGCTDEVAHRAFVATTTPPARRPMETITKELNGPDSR